ncbi:MAG: PadR family transcriptional regulator [Lachnospiraceae bacterium]|jgi:DNA-binding PadR family transcriptional regulator|nr:PadR family transcriptional regulator [Lachnospiraceae bacterium]
MRDHVKSGALTEVTFFILLSLYRPRHGYAVMQFIEEQTRGRLVLGAGSLYGALNTLNRKGWIEPAGEDDDRRKQYRITDTGRQIAAGELARLRALADTAAAIMEECTETDTEKEALYG